MFSRLGSTGSVAALLALATLLAPACQDDELSQTKQCTSKRDCEAGAACVAGSCRAPVERSCTADETCPFGQVCDQASGACVAPMVDPTPRTEPSTSMADRECSAGQRCDRVLGRCASGPRPCASEAGCADLGQHCDVARSQCVECRTAADCGANEKCTDGTCAAAMNPTECSNDAACEPPNTVCSAGACVRGCGSTAGALACTPGTTCDTATGRCTAAPSTCARDADCGAPAGVCESGRCLPGCAELGGITCQAGSTCDAQSGRCSALADACTTDAGCHRPSEICNVDTGTCEPGCATRGCTGANICDATTGRCVPPRTCTADALEENDTSAAARAVMPGSIQALSACPGDDDWYSITLAAGDQLRLTLSFDAAEGNIDLEVRDPSGGVVASGAAQRAGESVTYVATSAGAHRIRVFLASDAGSTPGAGYTMNVAVAAAPCGQDPYEDNDSATSPIRIVPGSLLGVNVCAGDDDFYALDVHTGDRIDATVDFTDLDGDIDLDLLDPSGTRVTGSNGTGDSESLTYTARVDGTFILRVFLYGDAGPMPGNAYSMDVNVTSPPMPPMPPPMPPPDPTCAPDRLEENDSASAAAQIYVGALSGLTLCAGDEDFYSVELARGDRLDVSVTATAAEGDVSLEILDPAGVVQAHSTGTTSTPAVRLTAGSAGLFKIHPVLGKDRGTMSGTTYDMVVAATTASGCRIDAWEPNDTLASAPVVPMRTITSLTACTGNEDDFAVDLTAGDTFVATATFSNREGDIDLSLFDEHGREVASAAETLDNERLSFRVATTGRYTLQVRLYRDDGSVIGNNYSLALSR